MGSGDPEKWHQGEQVGLLAERLTGKLFTQHALSATSGAG
jgi:hypothetical protein